MDGRIHLCRVVPAVPRDIRRSPFSERWVEGLPKIAFLKLLILLEHVVVYFIQVFARLLDATNQLLSPIRVINQ